jgi:DNA-binding MarR family transcriptional regulator
MFSPAGHEPRDSMELLESEMLTFVQRIDTTSRQSTMYQRMERAAYRIARLLDAHGAATVGDIARALDLDASTVTRQVAAMEARQQATRRVHPVDRRAWEIHLTAGGRADMHAITQARRKRFAGWLEGWDETDIEHFGRLLARFNAAVAAPAVPA